MVTAPPAALLLDALLEGFLGRAGRRYETRRLHAYAARVAGAVGAMMALRDGCATPRALARACDLGVAMQLTNIARDVGEDARNGGSVAAAWLREAGIDCRRLAARAGASTPASPASQRLLARRRLYRRAEHGVAELPRDCRAGHPGARPSCMPRSASSSSQGLDR